MCVGVWVCVCACMCVRACACVHVSVKKLVATTDDRVGVVMDALV